MNPMAERTVVLDKPTQSEEQTDATQPEKLSAEARADRAEAELAKLKQEMAQQEGGGSAGSTKPAVTEDASKQPPTPSSRAAAENSDESAVAGAGGEEELRKDSMMAYLLDSLDAGKDIGHYGRLVFAMVARHFMPHQQVLEWMMKDKDVDEEKATLMLRQVEGKDYTPPKRAKILEYQKQQDFPILPHPEDPDCGNLYRNLKFPDEVYQHIGHYQEAKLESGE
jgi:hypothetical protein